MANSGAVLVVVLPLVGVGRACVGVSLAPSHMRDRDGHKRVLP